MRRTFSPISAAIEALSQGRLVIVADSEQREDEGDFLAAAELITPEQIHFMLRRACGQLCVPVLAEVAERLQLELMVPSCSATAPQFTVPVDHVACRSGVSPWERCLTIRNLIDPASQPADFDRPGHIFPLIAHKGGLLQRAGHTEAAVELVRSAGLTLAGVLCEICSQNGINMASRDELFELAAEHDLPLIAIDDLISLRREQSPAPPISCAIADQV